MRVFRNLLVGLVLTLSVPASFATSFTAVEAAANAENWALADAVAARLDTAEQAGDFYAAFVAARRLASQGRCQEAAILFDTLTMTRPYFTPGYEGAFLCLMALGQKEMAIARLDTMLAVLPDGPQRDVVFQVRQNLDAADRPVFNVFGSFAPSSNANRQTGETRIGPFDISEQARARAGFLANIGASVTTRMIATDHFTMTGVARGELGFNTAKDVLEPRLT
ncbi:MAG TPA: hypothetical protein VL133_11770, partial [Devosia sp.]|nr:hypothetical protein [Devosia sp.]